MLGRAGGVLSYFTRHGTAANLILVLLLAAGAAAIPNMRAQFFPDVIIDNVTVSVNWSGAGAEERESDFGAAAWGGGAVSERGAEQV